MFHILETILWSTLGCVKSEMWWKVWNLRIIKMWCDIGMDSTLFISCISYFFWTQCRKKGVDYLSRVHYILLRPGARSRGRGGVEPSFANWSWNWHWIFRLKLILKQKMDEYFIKTTKLVRFLPIFSRFCRLWRSPGPPPHTHTHPRSAGPGID